MNITYRPRGAGTWRLRMELGRDPNGKRQFRYETIKGTEDDAQRRRFELLTAEEQGTLAVPEKVTLAAYFDHWIKARQAVGKITRSTGDTYRKTFELYISPTLGGTRLQKIRGTNVQGLYIELAGRAKSTGEPLSRSTLELVHAILSSAFRSARRSRLITNNPMEEVEPPEGSRSTPKAMRPEQVEKLMSSLEGDWKEPIAIVGLTAGLRRGEVLGLRWGDVDLDAEEITVRGQLVQYRDGSLEWTETKTEAGERVISLDGPVLDMLRRLRVAAIEQRMRLGLGDLASAYVFTVDGVLPHRPGTLTDAFSRHCEKHGLPEVTFHRTRHTHATVLLAKVGKNGAKAVSQRLGHTNVMTTIDLYQTVFREDDEGLGKLGGAIVSGRSG